MAKKITSKAPIREKQPKIYSDVPKPNILSSDKSLWAIAAKRIGRPLRFKTADDLWNVACEYFAWCDEHPLIEIDYRGKDATMVELPHPRPYHIRAFCIYAGVNETYINELEYTMRDRLEKDDEDSEAHSFSQTLAIIRAVCQSQKLDAAMVGLYNPMIAKCDLGLTDKVETKNENNSIVNVIVDEQTAGL